MRFFRIGMNQTDWGTNKLPTIADAMAVSRNALDGATLVSAESVRAGRGAGRPGRTLALRRPSWSGTSGEASYVKRSRVQVTWDSLEAAQ